jgi:hypothetical protein
MTVDDVADQKRAADVRDDEAEPPPNSSSAGPSVMSRMTVKMEQPVADFSTLEKATSMKPCGTTHSRANWDRQKSSCGKQSEIDRVLSTSKNTIVGNSGFISKYFS